jgi:hypothetical protein
MGKVYVTERDVIVIVRHDPNSSDPVDVSSVLSTTFFDGPELKVPEDQLTTVAEQWAIDREIEFIRNEADSDAAMDKPSKEWAAALTPENFTKQTDLWFECFTMPMLEATAT